MASHLLISVRFHEGRYHGAGDWPPSPARLFQALVAGAGLKGPLQSEEVAAFEWLESQSPPIIAAPSATIGQAFNTFVPNNDLDSVGGDPRNIASIRAKKVIRPMLFDGEIALLYAWPVSDAPGLDQHAAMICKLAERLYQLGRGVDLAWACAAMVGEEALEMQLAEHPGEVFRPSLTGSSQSRPCPLVGSFRSLAARYKAASSRFEVMVNGRSISESFRRQPKPRFAQVPYNSSPVRRIFDIRPISDLETWHAWPLEKATALIESVRDAACARLSIAFPDKVEIISRWLIRRRPDGTNGGSPADRIRMVPLPSIGSDHADHLIRRVLIEIPAGCPLGADDVAWAFNGLDLGDSGSLGRLVAASSRIFAWHFGIDSEADTWCTVTPVALPESAKRRRINPRRKLEEAKNATERAMEQYAARSAIHVALRHAGISTAVHEILVQREPFHARGAKADDFAAGTRFAKERLWHVKLRFQSPISGPLVLGNGRFLGLGLFHPQYAPGARPRTARNDEPKTG